MSSRVPGAALSIVLIATLSGCSQTNEQASSTRQVVHGSHRPVRGCATLTDTTWSDGSRVTSATDISADGATPEYCKVAVLVPDQISIVVEMPVSNWNGRYEALGGGGYDGSLSGLASAPTALAEGYVASATDTGHQGSLLSGSWAWSPKGMNQALIEDFAYRANHEMAIKSKDLIHAFYGSAPSYSYWNGCSSGGREGITEAVDYPEDFDGIVAESPAINWTRFVPAEEWPALVMKWMGDYLPSCKEKAVTDAVMAACNGTGDGTDDGLIDPRNCAFDPRRLIGISTPCGIFTAKDAAVVEEIWRGPRDQNGKFLWYGLEPGADLGPGISLAATAPAASTEGYVATPFPISDDWFRYWIHQNPTWNYQQESFDQYVKDFDASVAKWGNVLSTDDPNLTAFKDHGGKLILWHGLADQLIFPQGTIDYYNDVLRTMGGLANVSTFARLFLSPNSPHCETGTAGPLPVDPLAAVVKWRERGIAPATLLGAGTNPAGQTLSRNLCPYPERMAYNGHGDNLSASNFHCTGPPVSGSNGSASNTS